jgi:hypothetical protein
MKIIKFYKMPSGKSPIEEFLDSLSSKEAQKRKNEYLTRGDANE